MTADRCPRNHLYTPQTEKWYTHSNGKRYRTCGACAAMRARLRYRHDAAFREREKQRGIARYWAACEAKTQPQYDRHAPA
jgi:hypothetical protein